MHIVLYSPEIPHNAGAAGRLALATGSTLHLVEPLGFSLDEKAVRRAGLDYWKDVNLHVWESFDDLSAAYPEAQFRMLSTKASRTIWEAEFQEEDFLVFGPESKGLPEKWAKGEQGIRIPMMEGSTRSLNLSTSVAVVLYEAQRQIGKLS
ncbi:tRNA (cytidine(34)-2'-O)-methyltransferase [Akkermansiaceae bacterium]|nr:tRNA (cytidine(34)-2'-O)-methyltransferase [Akkermansiaceae bacterium]